VKKGCLNVFLRNEDRSVEILVVFNVDLNDDYDYYIPIHDNQPNHHIVWTVINDDFNDWDDL
jgi:hypothetical protein